GPSHRRSEHPHTAATHRSEEAEGDAGSRHDRSGWPEHRTRSISRDPAPAGRGGRTLRSGGFPLPNLHESGLARGRVARSRHAGLHVPGRGLRRSRSARARRAPEVGGGACGSLEDGCSSEAGWRHWALGLARTARLPPSRRLSEETRKSITATRSSYPAAWISTST